MLSFSEYQAQAQATAIYPPIGGKEIYPCLEVCNEAGELAGKVKKIYRDKGGEYTTDDLVGITAEVGDVLWGLSQFCTELGISLEEAAAGNLAKLKSRQERNKLQGSGDNR